MSTYVCSDIHGFYDRYKRLLDCLKLKDDDVLYVLGDVIDRGPDGIKILQDMMKRKNVVMFIGNHEFMMLDYLELREKRGMNFPNNIWLHSRNGGSKTLEVFDKLNKIEQDKIVEYLKNSYLQKEITVDNRKIMLCHAFYSKSNKDLIYKEAGKQVADCVVWYSPFRFDDLHMPFHMYNEDYIFVTGHVPTLTLGFEAPFMEENVIDVDGGCAISIDNPEYGNLCCIKLDGFFRDPFTLNIR